MSFATTLPASLKVHRGRTKSLPRDVAATALLMFEHWARDWLPSRPD